VKTKDGQGKVVDTQILTQLVIVEYESGDRKAVDVDEIEVLPSAAPNKKKDNAPKNKGSKDKKTDTS
ncbi:MAG: hypothetical protein JSW47_04670, partial [Phycisphaerales bacterium]